MPKTYDLNLMQGAFRRVLAHAGWVNYKILSG